MSMEHHIQACFSLYETRRIIARLGSGFSFPVPHTGRLSPCIDFWVTAASDLRAAMVLGVPHYRNLMVGTGRGGEAEGNGTCVLQSSFFTALLFGVAQGGVGRRLRFALESSESRKWKQIFVKFADYNNEHCGGKGVGVGRREVKEEKKKDSEKLERQNQGKTQGRK